MGRTGAWRRCREEGEPLQVLAQLGGHRPSGVIRFRLVSAATLLPASRGFAAAAHPSAGQLLAVMITQLNINPAIRLRNNQRTWKLGIAVIPGRNHGEHIIRRLRNRHRPGPRAQPVSSLSGTRPRSVRHRRIGERHDGNRGAVPRLNLHLPGSRLETGARIPVIVPRLEAVISERPRQRHPRRRRTGSSRTSRTPGQQHTAHQQQPATPTRVFLLFPVHDRASMLIVDAPASRWDQAGNIVPNG
jgi:hypothetical protein